MHADNVDKPFFDGRFKTRQKGIAMASIVYVPRIPEVVNGMYARSLPRRPYFVDNPVKEQVHFFRGVRQHEKKNFLSERYSIGPHDENPLLCGFHHAEVFGWWFDPKVHKREIDDDEVFWDAAVDLTPDHLDLKSKIKLIREFSLSPSKKWYGHLGEDWSRAFSLSQTDPVITSLLDAEDILLGLRFWIRKATMEKCVGRHGLSVENENYVDINTSRPIDIFDYLEKDGILENVISMRESITEKSFLNVFFGLSREIKKTSFRGNISELIQDIMTLAFVPVPKAPVRASMNMDNFSSAMEVFKRMDRGALAGRILDDSYMNPLFFIFANSCRNYTEAERDVYRFEFR